MNSVQLIKSERGKDMLVLDGFRFSYQKTLAGGKVKRWTCATRRTLCKAFVKTEGDENISLIEISSKHNHEKKNKIENTVKCEPDEYLCEQSMQVIHEELKINDDCTSPTVSDNQRVRTNMQFVKSGKGTDVLLLDGFRFYFQKMLCGGTVKRWLCASRHTLCKAFAKTKGDENIILIEALSTHNHKKKATVVLNRQIIDNTSKPELDEDEQSMTITHEELNDDCNSPTVSDIQRVKTNMQFVKSEKGKDVLLIDGFRFYFQKSSYGGAVKRWVCASRKPLCRAFVKTHGDANVTLIEESLTHNHEKKENQVPNTPILNNTLTHEPDEDEQSMEIVQDELKTNDGDSPTVSNIQQIKHNVQLVKSRRGNDVLVVDGFNLAFHKPLSGGKIKRWACASRKTLCRAFAKTEGTENIILIESSLTHNHEKKKPEVLTNTIKREPDEDLHEQSMTTIDDVSDSQRVNKNAQLVKSEDGTDMLVLDGFGFYFKNTLSGGTVKRWICASRETSCKAYVKTEGVENIIVIETSSTHNHEQNETEMLNQQYLTNTIKRELVEDLSEQSMEVMENGGASQETLCEAFVKTEGDENVIFIETSHNSERDETEAVNLNAVKCEADEDLNEQSMEVIQDELESNDDDSLTDADSQQIGYNVQLVKSQRGNDMLEIDGYKFVFRKTLVGGTIKRWNCASRKTSCKAFAKTEGTEDITLIEASSTHNHENKNTKSLFTNTTNREPIEGACKPSKNIIRVKFKTKAKVSPTPTAPVSNIQQIGKTMRLVKSEKGKDMLLLDGYKFAFQKALSGGIVKRWTCAFRKTSCKAFVKTKGAKNIILIEASPTHNHEKKDTRLLKRQILSNTLKRKAVQDLRERPLKIICDELKTDDVDSLTDSDIHRIVKNMYCARRSAVIAEASNKCPIKIEIEDHDDLF